MNVLHITGTKGKGSTSAFVSTILTKLAPAAKVGLYTSPHMVAVRERIRINDEPISEGLFARYFWEVWDKLETDAAVRPRLPFRPCLSSSTSADLERTRVRRRPTTCRPSRHTSATSPSWLCTSFCRRRCAPFPLAALPARRADLPLSRCAQVDATVLEVGIGGTYDSTNIVPQPVTTGITALGIDHIWVLGKTLPEIAHQKGGIYKVRLPLPSLNSHDRSSAELSSPAAWRPCACDPAARRTRRARVPSEGAQGVLVHRHPRARAAQKRQARYVHPHSSSSHWIALRPSLNRSRRRPPALERLARRRRRPVLPLLPSMPSRLL